MHGCVANLACVADNNERKQHKNIQRNKTTTDINDRPFDRPVYILTRELTSIIISSCYLL